jgi:hypothetical protein
VSRDLIRECLEHFRPGVLSRSLDEIITSNGDLCSPFMPHELAPQAIGIRVHVDSESCARQSDAEACATSPSR